MSRMDLGFNDAMKMSLKSNRVFLVNDLSNIEGIMDHLVQGGVFSDSEVILHFPQRMQKVRKLIDDLSKRPARDYWTFLHCLYYDTIRQGHIAEEILKKYEEEGGIICDADLLRKRQEYLAQQQRQQGELLQQQQHHQQLHQQQHHPDIVPEPFSHQQQQHNMLQPTPLWLQSQQEQSHQGHSELSVGMNSVTAQRWFSEGGSLVTSASGDSMDTSASHTPHRGAGIQVPDSGDGDVAQSMDETPAPVPATGDGLSSSNSRVYCEQRALNKDLVYKMESHPRGQALVIDNQNFEHLEHRVGTDQDSERLCHLFQDKLQFEVEIKKNLSAPDMLTALSSFITKLEEIANQVDACMVAILTHGGAGDVLYGTDGDSVVQNDTVSPKPGTFITVQHVQSLFRGCSCCSMRNKPKLFIIQACRGGSEDSACQRSYACDSDPMASHRVLRSKHEQADMVFLYATVANFVAYRNIFIQILADVFEEFAETKHLLELQTLINGRMSERVVNNHLFTISEGRTTLTKSWFLNPPPSLQ